jgi:hypothetical protein
MRSTLKNLLPQTIVNKYLSKLQVAVEASSGGISHIFLFVGLNASHEELNLRPSSFYYIPWNETNRDMDAGAIQDYYWETLLDPNVQDVSAGIVFASAKDPEYASTVMPGKSTVIVFSEARQEDFVPFQQDITSDDDTSRRSRRSVEYQQAKDLIEQKLIRSLVLNFPHLKSHIKVSEVGTPLTLLD